MPYDQADKKYILFFIGVITLEYQLPSHPLEGKWTIRVEAITQVYDQIIYVEQFYLPLFEVYYSITS